MTVITIVLIAIVLGVGTLIVTRLMNNVGNESINSATTQAACENAGGTWDAASQICIENNNQGSTNINGTHADFIPDNPYE